MRLMYLTRTRPDIKLAVCFLATRMSCASVSDQVKLKRILAYLNGTKDLCMKLKRSSMILVASVDASYNSHHDSKGQTGYVGNLGGNNGPVFAVSKKQPLVASSSTAAELQALAMASEDIAWTRAFLTELGFHQEDPTVTYQDNRSSILIANRGPGWGGKSKALKMRYFLVHERISDGSMALVHQPSSDLVADMLTKPLVKAEFVKLRAKLLNLD